MQLARHAKKCTKIASETAKKYILKDGVYVCCICNKSCAHQSNIMRQTKVYNGTNCKEKCNKYFLISLSTSRKSSTQM